MRCVLPPEPTDYPYVPGTNIPCCTDPRVFPITPPPPISISNWVELVRVDTVCSRSATPTEGPCCGKYVTHSQNNFNITTSGLSLKESGARFNMFQNQYLIFKLTQYDPWKIVAANFTDITTNKTVYFFVSKTIACNITSDKLKNIYTINLGNKHSISRRVNTPYLVPTVMQFRNTIPRTATILY